MFLGIMYLGGILDIGLGWKMNEYWFINTWWYPIVETLLRLLFGGVGILFIRIAVMD
jgi:hypothetical protein